MMFRVNDFRSGSAECRKLGLVHYLLKPLGEEDLAGAISRALGRRSLEKLAGAAERGVCQKSLRILVAEDNTVNQKLAARLLEKMGHHVVLVGDGAAAVRASQREEFDAILMDVQMPELDGFDASREIRRLERATGRHVPIVALTAHALRGDRDRCLAAGMDNYLSKPLQVTEITGVLDRVTDPQPRL